MHITFLGVGEAFDDILPNNSHLLISEKTKLTQGRHIKLRFQGF